MTILKRATKVTFVFLVIALCLSGCQATPENKAVQGKQQDYLKDLNNANVNNDMTAIPSTVEKSIKLSKGNVNINAKVLFPEINKFPVVKIKPTELTNEDIYNFKNTIFPGQTLYAFNDTGTKEDLEKEIIAQKEIIAKIESGLQGEVPEDLVKMHKDGLVYLERQYQSAISANELKEIETDGGFVLYGDNGWNGGGYVKADSGERVGITAYKSLSLKYNYIRMNNYSLLAPNLGFEIETTENIEDATITYEQAKAKAESIKNQLNLNDFSINAHGHMRFIEMKNNMVAEIKGPEEQEKGYFFVYTRSAAGIPATYIGNVNVDLGNEKNPQYAEFLDDEYLRVEIDKNGNLLNVSMECPMENVETMTDNVQLLSFNEIIDKFEAQYKTLGSWADRPDITNKDVNIREIKLGMCRIALKDNPDEYIMVPVWDFFGSETHQTNTGIASDQGVRDGFRQSFMTINAIDGSIIDRTLGY